LTESAGNILFSEFGTRRRRSYMVHDAVIKGLIEGDKEWATTEDGKKILAENGGKKSGGLAGTSNVSYHGYVDCWR
jgi:nicotinate phosphoribosyltransferase